MTEPRQASIWVRPHQRARGPAPEYQLSDIATAAIDLADAGGLKTVSMRAVAAALGTTASTLYRYVASRDELLELMVDTVMAGFTHTPAPETDWLDELVRIAGSTRRLYQTHAWLMDVRPAHSAPGPNTLEWFDHCLRALEPLDVPGLSKMEAIGLLNGVVILFARSEAASTAYDFSAMTPTRHPHLVNLLAGANRAADTASGDLFERAIRALMRGLLTG